MKLDAVAKESHFVDHIAPIWLALPEAVRGTLYFRGRGQPVKLPGMVRGVPRSGNRPTLTASAGDLQFCRNVLKRTRVAIMEHGCGQSFGGMATLPNGRAVRGSVRDHASYAGGEKRDAQLFLHPGPHPAARDHARYPNAQVEVVGCSRLDALPRKPERDEAPVIAVSFHWNCHVVPETRWALPEFERHVKDLAAQYHVIGHGHPRAAELLERWYKRSGIEWVPTFEEVCQRADLYVNDASSTLFEFASTGRPVVVMNPNIYRRNVNHGLRFWEASTVGVNASPRTGLIGPVAAALVDDQAQRAAREAALDLVYAYRSGAAERAAAVLAAWT